ncbi:MULTISPECIES: acyltransferase family protein [Spirosoma]|nr:MULTISPECIES: acyltransferase [Spirosoma]
MLNPFSGSIRSPHPSTATASSVSVRSGHMPQLDSLRTIAVMLVVIYHWFPTGVGINRLPNGSMGVMIFFVISGFLITRILLDNRNRISLGKATVAGTYRNFFIRRVLRIFPLYYLVLTGVWLLIPQHSDIDAHPLYYYLYGYNILLHQTGNWSDVLSPFWTLGVEEQLYLVWPWIVLLTPRSAFRWVIGGMIVLGVLFRAYGYARGDIDGLLTPASADAFGLGALWAYVLVDRPAAEGTVRKRLGLIAGLAFAAFVGIQFLPDDHLITVLFQRLVLSILALFIVSHASAGIGGPIGQVLNNRILLYIGRISYGIYVFHMLVPGHIVPILFRISNRLGVSLTLGYWSHRLFSLAVLIAIASASWYAFEKPINDLKRYFSYR